VAGRAGQAGHLTSGPAILGCAAGHPRGPAYLEPDPGVASPCALFGHGWWPDARRALESGAQWVSPTCTSGDGRLSEEDGGGDPTDLCAWRVGPARADASAAVAQSPEPRGPPDADEVERADHGALCARRGGGHISRPLSARRPPQECPACGVGRGPCHLHLSHSAGGG